MNPKLHEATITLMATATQFPAIGGRRCRKAMPGSKGCLVRACRAVEAAAESASDVVGRAFWWSNCIQLRWMLWAMSHGGSLDSEYGQELGGSVDDFDWVMQVWLLISHGHLTESDFLTPVADAASVVQPILCFL